MDAGPSYSCKHDIQIAQLVFSKSKRVYAQQRITISFCFNIS
jgi:hypothetical protein